MKMLLMSGGIPSPIGQIHLFNLLKVIGATHDVRVVCFHDSNHPPIGRWRDLHLGEDSIAIPLLARKHVIWRVFTSALRGTTVAVETYRSRRFADAVAQVCRKERFDVAVVEQLALGQYFPLVRHIPNVLFPVDAVSRLKAQHYQAAVNPLAKVAYALDCRMTRRYEQEVYRQFDGVIFVSSEDARYAVDTGQIDASRVHILPNGVDLEYFHPESPSAWDGPSLAFLGNMKNGINEHAVLWFHAHVWPILRHLIPDLQFSIVGSDPSERLRRCVQRDHRVTLTGYQNDIRPYIWNATLFVSPLQIGTGIKNRVLQAMAMGKAIVASPLSVEGMDVRDGEHLMIARDADAFVRTIRFLLDDASARVCLSREARRFVERHHSLAGAASRFLDIITRIAP